jgi:surfeit locus 1 family protein
VRRWSGILLAVFVILASLVMAGLGFWQLDRLQQRRAEIAEIRAQLAQPPLDLDAWAPKSLPEYRPVRVRGTFDFAQEVVLRNRSHLQSPGVHVLSPLRIAGSQQAVLVNRGWIPISQSERDARAAFHQPAGEVVIEGIVRPAQERPYAFLPADPIISPEMPRLDAWFWVNLDQMQQQLPYLLLPYYVEAAASGEPGLPVAAATVELDEGSHLGYAIQWFSFALILAGGSLALWRQRQAAGRRPRREK